MRRYRQFSANRPLTIEELRDSISSELEGNPPLWITRRPGTYVADVYINNAKILLEQSNFQSKLKVNDDTMTQVSRWSLRAFLSYNETILLRVYKSKEEDKFWLLSRNTNTPEESVERSNASESRVHPPRAIAFVPPVLLLP